MRQKMIARLVLPAALGVAAASGIFPRADSTPAPDWRIGGPFGGTATAIALNHQQPNVVLAGGMSSLLYRSDDAAANWTVLNFPKLSLSEITSLLFDPADSSHYLAGVVSADGGGLFESADAGRSWQRAPQIKAGVRALAAAPSQPSRFLAGTLDGAWLSDDSGKSWQRISDTQNLEMQGITAVAFDTKDANIMYAGTMHLPWKTMDGGKTWQSIHTGMIDDSDVFSIFVDPNNPASVFASACSGVYASSDRGDQWHKLLGIPNTSRRTHVIREDLANPNVIYAGTTTGLFKSLNHGTTWKTMTDTQVNAMSVDPTNPNEIYLALNYNGIGKSIDGGQRIDLVNHGYVDRNIASITRSGDKLVAVEPSEGDSPGIFVSSDRGENWSQLHTQGLVMVHLLSIAGLRNNDRTLLASSNSQVFKSLDGGLSWKPLALRVVTLEQPKEPLRPSGHSRATSPTRGRTASRTTTRSRAVRPAKPIERVREIKPGEIRGLYSIPSGADDFIYAATDLGLLRSKDAGERWTITDLPASSGVIALYSAPNHEGYLVARGPAGLLISKDHGDHWSELSFPLPVSEVNDIAVPPDPNLPLLVGTRLGLYSSRDGGEKWYANLGGIPASTISAVLYDGQKSTAYAIEYGQLFETKDPASSWERVPSALPNLRIRQLWMPDTSSGRLYGITSDLGILFRN
jgi:photosystem II stability/assembly factor-like uncharacterized protein